MADDIPVCPGLVAETTAPKFDVPAGASDSHFHVFGPESVYAYSPKRGYTPPDALPSTLNELHRILGIERRVYTQPSVYGTDNSAMMDAVAEDPLPARAIIAVDRDVSDKQLEDWHNQGARGVRFNLVDKGGMPFDTIDEVIEFSARLKPFGWHVEFLIHVNTFENLAKTVADMHVDVVVGHMGYMKTDAGLDNPGFLAFLEVLKSGKCWAKMTDAYRVTVNEAPPYDDVVPLAQALIAAAPDQLIWGSDWPHPWHYREMPNDGYLLDQVADWTDDPAVIQKMLVDNPVRLYGFSD